MKTMTISLIILLGMGLTSFTQQNAWNPTTCSAATCKIEFPTAVELQRDMHANKTSYIYETKHQKHHFKMTCVVYNNGATAVVDDPTSRVLNAHIKQIDASTSAGSIGLTMGAIQGKQVSFTTNDDKTEGILQVFVKGSKIYKLEVAASKGKLDRTLYQQFFDSFEIL